MISLNPFAWIGAILTKLTPDVIAVRINAILDQVRGLLTGEPAIVIGNGAAIVVYIVAKASGKIPDQSFDQAMGLVATAFVLLNSVLLTIRKYVYSPAAVAEIVATPPTAAGPINAAAAAGVDPAVLGQAIVAAPDAAADVAVAPEVVAAMPAPSAATEPEVDPSTIADGGDAG